jgi:hypothetical protein
MPKPETPKDPIAQGLARKRWAKVTKEERSRIMRQVASNPRPNAKGKKKPRNKITPAT